MICIHFIVFCCMDGDFFDEFDSNSYFWLNDTPQYIEWDLPGVSFEVLQDEISKLYFKPTNLGEVVRSIDYIIVLKKRTEQKDLEDILFFLQELSEEIDAISETEQEKSSNRNIPDWLQELSDEINAIENKYKVNQPTPLELKDTKIIDLGNRVETVDPSTDVLETQIAMEGEDSVPPIMNQNSANKEEPFHEGDKQPVHEGNNQPGSKEPVHEDNSQPGSEDDKQPGYEEPVHEGNNQPGSEKYQRFDIEEGYEADDELSDSSDDELSDSSDDEFYSDHINHGKPNDQNDSQYDDHHLPPPNQGDNCDKHHIIPDNDQTNVDKSDSHQTDSHQSDDDKSDSHQSDDDKSDSHHQTDDKSDSHHQTDDKSDNHQSNDDKSDNHQSNDDSQYDDHHLPLPNQGDECDKHHVIDEHFFIKYVGKEKVKLVAAYKIFKYDGEIIGSCIVGGINSVVKQSEEKVLPPYFLGINTTVDTSPVSRQGIEYLFEDKGKSLSETGEISNIDIVRPFSKIRVFGIVSRRNTHSFIIENTRSFFHFRSMRFIAKFMRQVWMNEGMMFNAINPVTLLKPISLDIRSAFAQPLLAIVNIVFFRDLRSWFYFKVGLLKSRLSHYLNLDDGEDFSEKVENTEVFRRKTHGFQPFVEVLNIVFHKDTIAMKLRAFNFKNATVAVLQVILLSCAGISLYRYHSRNITFVPLANVIWLKKKASIESFYKYQHKYSNLQNNRYFNPKKNNDESHKFLNLIKAYRNQEVNYDYKNLLYGNIETIEAIDFMIFNQLQLPKVSNKLSFEDSTISEKIIQGIMNLLQGQIYSNEQFDYFSTISFRFNFTYWGSPFISLIKYFAILWYKLVLKYLADVIQLSIPSESEIQIENLNKVYIVKSKSYYLYNQMLFQEHLNIHHAIDVVGITNQTMNNNLHQFIVYLDSILNMQTKRYNFTLLQKNTQEFRKLMDLLYTSFFDDIIYKKNSKFSSIHNFNQNNILYIENQIYKEIINIRNKNFINKNSLENISSGDKPDFLLNQYNNIIPQFTKNYKTKVNCLQNDFYRYSNSLNGVNLWKSMTILLNSNKLNYLLDNRSRITSQRGKGEYDLKQKYPKLDTFLVQEIQYTSIPIESLKEYFVMFFTLEWWNMFTKTSLYKHILSYVWMYLYNECVCFRQNVNYVINLVRVNFQRGMNELIQFIQNTYNQIIVSERFQFLFYRFQIVPQIFYWLSYALQLFYKYLLITVDYVYLIILICFFTFKSLAIKWRSINSYLVKYSDMVNLKIRSSDKFSSLSTVFNSLNTYSGLTSAWTNAFGIGSLITSHFFTVGVVVFTFILWKRFERVRYLLLPNSYTELDLLVFLRYRRNREKFIGRKINDEEDDLLQNIYLKSLSNSFFGLRIKLANTLGRKLLTSYFVDTATADVFYHARKLACQLLISEPEIAKINLANLESSLLVTYGPYVTEAPRRGFDYLNKVVRSTFSSYLKKTNFPVKTMTLLASEREWLSASDKYLSLILDPITTTPLSRGVLLIGPPDTGKHFLSKSIASDNNFPLVYFSIEDLLTIFEFENEPTYSESSAYFFRENIVKISVMMDFYKLVSPCVVWMPILESINNSYVSSRVRRVAMTLFSRYLLKDIKQTRIKHKNTIFIASSEDTSYLDPGFICEGLFDRVISVRRPNNSRRPQIFARLIKVKGFKLYDELDWYPTFANNSMGYSMRELAYFANRVCQDYILYDDNKNSFNLADLKKLIIKEMRATTGGGKYDTILSRYELQYKIGRVLIQMLFVKPQPTVSLFARMDVWANELYTLSKVFLEPGIEESALNQFTILRYILSYLGGFAARSAWLILHPEQINPMRQIGVEADQDILLASNLFAGIFKYFAHCELIKTNSLVPNFRHLYGTHTIDQTFLPVSRPSLSEDNKKEIGIEIIDPTMSPLQGYQPKYEDTFQVEVIPELIREVTASPREYRIAMSRTIQFEVMKKIDEPLAPLSAEKYYGKLCINSLLEEKHRADVYLYYSQIDTGKYTVAYNLDYEHYLMFLKQRIKEMKLKKAKVSILDTEYNPLVDDIVLLEGKAVWNPSAFEPRNVIFRNRGLYVNEELMCVYHSHYKAQKGYSVYENPFLMHRKTLRRRIWNPDEYYERIAIEKIRELQEQEGIDESNLIVYGQNEPEEYEPKPQMKGPKKDKKRKLRAAKILGKRKQKRLTFYKYKHLIYANSIFRRPRIDINRKYDAPSKKKIDQSRFSGISILQEHFAQYRSFNRPTYLQERLVQNCIFECYTYLVKFFITHQELLINVTDALLGEIRLIDDQLILIVMQYYKRINIK